MRRIVAPVAMVAASVVCAAEGPRQELSLNGAWQCQVVAREDAIGGRGPANGATSGRGFMLSGPPASGEWKGCTVPGYLSGTDYQRAWLRRSFAVPAEMRGRRIKIHFGGVKFNSRVYVNGKHVGGCFGGHEPFEVDVTDAVRFDGPNELAVGCHDWTGVFTPGKVEFPKKANWDAVRNAPRDKILSPIGGLYGLYGIWDDVTLRAHRPVYVKDLFIKPSVRRGELVVEYTVANESARDTEADLSAIVEDQGKDVLTLPAAKVKIAAGSTAVVTLRQPWPKPPLWSHIDPHLLHLRTSLSSGDRLRTRFGFREFWVEGHKFFLNGSRINLLATSWWPPHGRLTREEIRKQWETIKRIGCVAFRTHTQPWPSLHYEVADEVGLLMIIEGAVWNDDDTYRIHDPVFWKNYAGHLKAMVDRDKNRPSVVTWSLENEFFGARLNDASSAKKDLVRMGRLVKEWDPTRPIFYESDGDPDGVADVIGIHYPHEYPDFTCWPNEAYWLEKPAAIHHMFLNGENEFVWKKDKPIYVGEFLWIPSRDPSWHTVFFGDEAYQDYHRYRNLAKAESWQMQILGYRHLEVGGISPWTVIEGGPMDETNPLYKAHQYAYQHVAAYPLDFDRRFYSGDRVERRVDVFNDVIEPSSLEFAWTLSSGGATIGRGSRQLRLKAGDRQSLEVALTMPRVDRRTEVVWRLAVLRDGQQVFDDRREFAVFPRARFASVAARIGLFDPAGATARLLDRSGLHAEPVADLQSIPAGLDVLVIGAGTLKAASQGVPVIGRVAPGRTGLAEFAGRGGRVLVLHQDAYPDGLFDVTLSAHRSTMTFAQRPDHPALAGLQPGDLKFWRGDHLVATGELLRPTAGSAVPIVVSGSAAGIDHAPLLERRIGRGCVVHSQLLLAEKFDTEPAAARILVNLVEYLVAYRAEAKKTAVVGGSEAYRTYLRGLGLRLDDLTGKVASTDLRPYGLVICRGESPGLETLRPWVEAGGNLWLHRTPADSLARVGREFKWNLAARPDAGPVIRAEGDSPLLNAVAREDLYWLGKHVGIAWADTPRAGGMCDLALTKVIEGTKVAVHEVEDWKLEGGIVERRPPGVVFASVGSASKEIDFPVGGDYLFGVHARGTPCFGVYPIARVAIDGKPIGEVSVTGQWETTTVLGRVSAGKHAVSVAFINDGSDPPREDRNLLVDKVLIARDDNADGVRFLTSPGALALADRGKGRVLVDQLRWDTEEQNARKAARLVCSLLTELGGDFRPRLGTTIECARMTPQPGMPFFSNQGGHAALACNGYVQTPIQVAAAGRYSMELVASGTPAAGVYPLVELAIDGKPVGRVQLTSGAWRSYFLDLDLPAGNHDLRLSFVNDLNANGEDRNLRLDKMTFVSP